ncbi:MAG: hypothetical protein QME81_19080 [bacterium]|nr:hypothetical protein [bacterium]
MNEDHILQKYLAKAAEDAEKEIIETGKITVENAIPIILISQVNHLGTIEKKVVSIEKEIKDIKVNVANMQANMATKDDIANMATKDDIANMATKEDFSEFKSDIKQFNSNVKHWMMFGIAILALAGTLIIPFLSLFITRLLGN